MICSREQVGGGTRAVGAVDEMGWTHYNGSRPPVWRPPGLREQDSDLLGIPSEEPTDAVPNAVALVVADSESGGLFGEKEAPPSPEDSKR